jgi:hypothetical protein
MQMDAYLKKEQNGTLFCLVGALEGGFGGWVVPQGCPPQKVKNKKYTPSWPRLHNIPVYPSKELVINLSQ